MLDYVNSFSFLMTFASFSGVLINLVGLLHPEYVTRMESRDFGFVAVNPSVVWFLGALLFLTIFCIPCLTVASANLCSCCWDSSKSKNRKKGRNRPQQESTEQILDGAERTILEDAALNQLTRTSKPDKKDNGAGTAKSLNDDFVIEMGKEPTPRTQASTPYQKKHPKEKKK